ncbi:hypothetical protein RCCGE510_27736 (plasmid) [Rhizobium sp. CCGE 510]|nr:hypothetical protein RCCGE510_27736 [Rhizobium sp. CCGE 510]
MHPVILRPQLFRTGMEYPTAQVVEIVDYISCMYDCSSCTLSVQFHAEVRMDIMALLLVAFGLDSFK